MSEYGQDCEDGRIGDSICDWDITFDGDRTFIPFSKYNRAECGYDGGDCCESTCNGVNCGENGFDCQDPDARGNHVNDTQFADLITMFMKLDGISSDYLFDNMEYVDIIREAVANVLGVESGKVG